MSKVSMALARVGVSKRLSASSTPGSSCGSVASPRRLAPGPTQSLHHPRGASAQKKGVIVNVEHSEARIAPSDGRLRAGAMDAGRHLVALTRLQDGLDQTDRKSVV